MLRQNTTRIVQRLYSATKIRGISRLAYISKLKSKFAKAGHEVYFWSGIAGIAGVLYWSTNKMLDANHKFITMAKTAPSKSTSEEKGKEKSSKKKESDKQSSNDIPEHVTHLIIGAGTSGLAAAQAIRLKNPLADVLMVGEEEHPPYLRPPLSKELLWADDRKVVNALKFPMWDGKPKSIFYHPDVYFFTVDQLRKSDVGGVALIKGRQIIKVDPRRHMAYFDDGQTIIYDKCLIATGGKPKRLPVFENASEEVKKRVTRFRTVGDFQEVMKALDKASSVAVIGGGFLGTELSFAFAHKKKHTGLKDVIQIFPEAGVLGLVMPNYLSQWITRKAEKSGVRTIPGASIEKATFKDNKIHLLLTNGTTVKVDHIIQAVGLNPNVKVARNSGLEIDSKCGGIMVNTELQARTDLFVSGDAACFYDMTLGRRRIEHHSHAEVSGTLAGENMMGAAKPYLYQSGFWSDLGPLIGFSAIGIVDGSLETQSVFTIASEYDTPKALVEKTGQYLKSDDPKVGDIGSVEKVEDDDYSVDRMEEMREHRDLGTVNIDNDLKGVVFYMRGKKIVGILLWNVFGKLPACRKILRDQVEYDDVKELAKLLDVYDSLEEDELRRREKKADAGGAKSK